MTSADPDRDPDLGPGRGPKVAPLLAAVVAAALTVLGFLIWRAFEAAPCEGFGCLGPALLALVTIPIVTTVVGWLTLRRLRVPRAFLIALATLASSFAVASTVDLGALDVLYWPLPALLAAAWTWVLSPGRPRWPAAALAAVIAVVALTSTLLTERRVAQDSIDRLNDTTAPQLVLPTSSEWELISADAEPERFDTLYDAADDDQFRVRISLATPGPDPGTDCAAATAAVFDTPGDSCTDRGDGVYEVRTGNLVTWLAVTPDALVGLSTVYSVELTEDQVREFVAILEPGTGAEIRDRIGD